METWEGLITMSQKEAPRVGLVKAALARNVSNAALARSVNLSIRQVRRLKGRFRAEGARGLVHRGRGRASPRRLAADVRERMVEVLKHTYWDFNDCHALTSGRPISRPRTRKLRTS